MGDDSLTISKAIQLSSDFLKKRGFAQPRLEAELLLANVLSTNRLQLYLKFDKELSDEEKIKYREALKRRADFEPVAYIIGEKEFLSRPFFVDRSTLIPRPETELLVEKTIDIAKELSRENGAALKVLEIGVGSGIIAVSLALSGLNLEITATDISEDAINIAVKNAERHNAVEKIRFIKGDLFEGAKGSYDIIVSNPPYVGLSEKDALAKDIIDWEPHSALFAGEDGLDIARRIIAQAPANLNTGGYLIFEIGMGQDENISKIISDSQELNLTTIVKDYAKIPRVVIAKKD